ncbi:methyltransferase domain-containing protein [Actinomadura rupiterrae]|uniref:methyltransferase domain-containing protein n=1 Tax=Actinomadura rupiterrae TaxID=559627 RepID=UPI0020A446C6|nr:methyltransferase domain-containing protein [Actinomadura rupiterrae]MCP2335259.1 protein-L-isoaspartate(D-aspartate) O-methyltransferase [Actinomadura rupiterrae]
MINLKEALRAVRRADFIPDRIFVSGPGNWLIPLSRDQQPERWAAMVASPSAAVVTKVARDPLFPPELSDPSTGRGMVATSSSSAPELMAEMIEALELEPGMRVLEIGTGTGYNAALLAYLLGSENVVSVEIDAEVADRARGALQRTGYRVKVITGDGEQGYAADAPYDRVIATAAAHTVPYAWVEQTRPGGVILVPWAETVHPDGRLARFVVGPDGIAEGRFISQAFFMPLQGQRLQPHVGFAAEERWEQAGRPDFTRYGITVTERGQTIWLDSPEHVVAAQESP